MRKSRYYTVMLHTKIGEKIYSLGYVCFIAKTGNTVTKLRFKRFIDKAARLSRIPVRDIHSYTIANAIAPTGRGIYKPIKVFIPSPVYIKKYGKPDMPYVDLMEAEC